MSFHEYRMKQICLCSVLCCRDRGGDSELFDDCAHAHKRVRATGLEQNSQISLLLMQDWHEVFWCCTSDMLCRRWNLFGWNLFGVMRYHLLFLGTNSHFPEPFRGCHLTCFDCSWFGDTSTEGACTKTRKSGLDSSHLYSRRRGGRAKLRSATAALSVSFCRGPEFNNKVRYETECPPFHCLGDPVTETKVLINAEKFMLM